jgi:hypothetical protein
MKIYIACPFTKVQNKEDLIECLSKLTANMFARSLVPFSPILHNWVAWKAGLLPTEAVHWREYNRTMIQWADALYLVTFNDWKESDGVRFELNEARFQEIPVYTIDPETLTVSKGETNDANYWLSEMLI